MAESKGLGDYVVELIVMIVLCGVGVIYWSHFRPTATYVRGVLSPDPSSQALIEQGTNSASAQEDMETFKKCVKDDFHDLWEHPVRHVAHGEAELVNKAINILQGDTCRPELVGESKRIEALRDPHFWSSHELSELRNQLPILVSPNGSSSALISSKRLTDPSLTPEELEHLMRLSQARANPTGQWLKAFPVTESSPQPSK
jgi:hypothetical protein